MTDQLDVKAIRDLCLKATHGPWYAVPPPWANGEWVNAWSEDPHGGKPICDCSMQIDHDDGSEEFEPRCIPDADFIAQSRTLIPKLCDEVERLRIIIEGHEQARKYQAAHLDVTSDALMKAEAERDRLRAELDALKGKNAE